MSVPFGTKTRHLSFKWFTLAIFCVSVKNVYWLQMLLIRRKIDKLPNFQSSEVTKVTNSDTAKDAVLAAETTRLEIFEPVWFDDASLPTLCDTSQARRFKDLTEG